MYYKNELVTRANLNYGRDKLKLKNILVDHIGFLNCALIVTDTFDGDGNRTCTCKVGCYNTISLIGYGVIRACVESEVVNNNADIGRLLECVVVYSVGNVNVVAINRITLNYVFLGNIYGIVGIVVADTLYENDDLTCVSKVGGYNTVSQVGDLVINSFNERLCADDNPCSGLLCICVIDNVVGNKYVGGFDLGAADHVVLRNRTGIITLTLYGNDDCAGVSKVGGYISTSCEGYSIISIQNKRASANSNGNGGNVCKSIVDYVIGNNNVAILDRSALDREVICYCIPIVVYTFYDYGNFALVCEICGYAVISKVCNDVINTLDECMSANRNINSGSLICRVVYYVAGNGHVTVIDLSAIDYVFLSDYAGIISYTVYDNENCTCVSKVSSYSTVSYKGYSIICIQNKRAAANSNGNCGNVLESVIDNVVGNDYVRPIDLGALDSVALSISSSGVISNTVYRYSDRTLAREVAGSICTSAVAYDVFRSLIEHMAANLNDNVGKMLGRIINNIIGNRYILESYGSAVDGVSCSYVILRSVVAYTLYHNGDCTGVCEVGGLNAVSEVRYFVVNALNEYARTDSNRNDGLLLRGVLVGYVIGNVYVSIQDLVTFDLVFLLTRTGIIALTLYDNGNCTYVGKVGGYSVISLEGYGVVYTLYKSLSTDNDLNIGDLRGRIIDHIIGNGYVRISDRCLLNFKIVGNSINKVVNALYDNADHTYVGKVGGCNAVSQVCNLVVNTLDKCKSANGNRNGGDVRLRIVDHVVGDDNVSRSDLGMLYLKISLANTLVVAYTLYNRGNYTRTCKVRGRNTVSRKGKNVISAFNECESANLNGNVKRVRISVISSFNRGKRYVTVRDLCLLDRIISVCRIYTVGNFNTIVAYVNGSIGKHGRTIVVNDRERNLVKVPLRAIFVLYFSSSAVIGLSGCGEFKNTTVTVVPMTVGVIDTYYSDLVINYFNSPVMRVVCILVCTAGLSVIVINYETFIIKLRNSVNSDSLIPIQSAIGR